MRFWGLEIKPGKPVKYTAQEGEFLHLTQAALTGTSGRAALTVKCDQGDFLLGTLTAGATDQFVLDHVFESSCAFHNSHPSASIHLTGYVSSMQEMMDNLSDEGDEDEEGSDEEEMDLRGFKGGRSFPSKGKGKANGSADDDEDEDDDDDEDDDEEDDDDEDDEDEDDDDEGDEGDEDDDEEEEDEEDDEGDEDEDDDSDEEEDEEDEFARPPPSKKQRTGGIQVSFL
eukprot:jgi/Mesvir1/4749/Mv26268-RA.1